MNTLTINPTIGGTVHVTVEDQANVPLPPSGVVWAATPNPSGFVAMTPDATGFNFKGLAAGQFTYTATYPVGPTPYPTATLTVIVGPTPTALNLVSP